MTATPPDLAALVGSRIAHDLANPLGAIANGVELLGLTGTPDSPELALITESVNNATARIKAFRIAFGAAPPGQLVKAADLAALLGPAAGRKLSVDWTPVDDIPRPEAKLAMLALMCCDTAMPRGGAVQVTRSPEGAWQIAAGDAALSLNPALWACLAGDAPPEIAPAQVHFPLLAHEARAQGRRLSVVTAPTALDIRF